MDRGQPNLEWEYLSDDDPQTPWPPAPPAGRKAPETGSPAQLRHIVLFAITMAFLLTAGIGTIYANNEAQKGIAEVEEGVQASVEVASWVQSHAPELSPEILIDDTASDDVEWMLSSEDRLLRAITQQGSPVSEIQVTETRFRGSSAVADVQVTVPAPGVESPLILRQTRFYRETPQGWLRTQPDPRLWGAQRSFETDHLVWRYRQRDEETVLAVVQEVDALYAQWRRDHALPERPEKLVVDVRVDVLPSQMTQQQDAGARVIVPSPAVYLAPPQYSDADLLLQSAAIALARSLRQESVYHGYEGAAQKLADALHLWTLMEAGLPLFEPAEAFLAWYIDETGPSVEGIAAVPQERIDDVCTAFAVWMVHPSTVYVPVNCDRTVGASVAYPGLFDPPRIPPQLGPTLYEQNLNYAGTYQAAWWRTMLLATVIDYAVETYGRDSLPILTAALGQHKRWDTLVPAVYGVSFAEFEDGWRMHLQQIAAQGVAD